MYQRYVGVDDPLFEEELEAEIRKRVRRDLTKISFHRRVSDELLCQVGQCYESLKQHLPQFEQQRAEWLLDQLSKIQQFLETFKGEVVREVLSLENRMSEFQKRQEQVLTMSLQYHLKIRQIRQSACFAVDAPECAKPHDRF